MSTPTIDRPWRRPGAAAYGRRRVRAALRPPVTVYAMSADIRKDTDVPVQMRDGVTLRLNLFRPAGEGPFPVLLSAHPYGKDALPQLKHGTWSVNPQFRIMNQSAPFQISDQTSWEAPDPAWWAGRGYAVINLDTRGGGHSEGRGDLLSDEEAEDISEVIAWAADQSWSTGEVGMIGVSYLAMSQYKVAALNPPALKAICPWEGFTDAYRDFFTPGGVVEDGFARVWLFLTGRAARLKTNLAAERKEHPLRDAWWEALTPNLRKITIPILECTSFSDDNLHSGGSMRAFQRVGSEHRHAYSHRGPKWATFYGEEARRHQLAFFDRYLRGDRDAPFLPPLRLEIRDRLDRVVELRDEQEWPLARTNWRQLHLAAKGELSETEAVDGSVTFDLRRNAAAFEYRFQQDTELSGPMTLRMHVAITGAKDPKLFVGVEKWSRGTPVPFEGSYGYGRDHVAQGRLRLALRELDPALSTPHQPEFTFRTLQPLGDNEQLDVVIPLSSSAT
ncbi:MAG TPA: CocE/NonD family hydrolase, partial [Galbitalea sp.]